MASTVTGGNDRLRNGKLLRRHCVIPVANVLYALLLSILYDNILAWQRFDIKISLSLPGDIESNPDPNREHGLKFYHWKRNSICSREGIKIPLMEAL